MPIYHYHAIKQIALGQIMNIDGIAVLKSPVATMDDYKELKKLISDTNEIGGPEGLTICSLTPLLETPNVEGKGRCAALYRAASSDRRERP